MNVVFGFKEFAFLLTGLKWTVLLSLIAFSIAFRSCGLNGLMMICVAAGALIAEIDRISVGLP